jgi:hypothetical protein
MKSIQPGLDLAMQELVVPSGSSAWQGEASKSRHIAMYISIHELLADFFW